MKEREIQRAIVADLRDSGFTVCVTSDNRRARVKGTPDLFVSIGRGLWTGLEVKSDTGKVRPEQERLMASGNIHVVRSVQEARAAVAYSARQLKET